MGERGKRPVQGDMEKLYVNEIRPSGEISTVGLFYSRAEAEGVVERLRRLSEKQDHKYTITESPPKPPEATSGKARRI